MPNTQRAVLFVNGEAKDLSRLPLNHQDYLVAVDGGLRHLDTLGLRPHLLIGDFDSIDASRLQALAGQGVAVQRFPPAKNQTDLELALDFVLQQGFTRILIVAALGGRLDQTLANLALLSRPDLYTREVCLDDGHEIVFLIRKAVTIPTTPGDTLSLLPLCEPATGITTQGLSYPLTNETLYAHQTRGISNQAASDQVSIQLTAGVLLCIHTRQS